MDSNRVKTPAPSQSPTSHRVGSVEPGDGSGTQLRIESGERLARPAPGATGRDAATTVPGVVLSGLRQSRQDPSHVVCGNVCCSLTALRAGVVARRAPGTGSGPGRHAVGTTVHHA